MLNVNLEELFSEQDSYKNKDKDTLLAILRDRERLIERLWVELKDVKNNNICLLSYMEDLGKRLRELSIENSRIKDLMRK